MHNLTRHAAFFTLLFDQIDYLNYQLLWMIFVKQTTFWKACYLLQSVWCLFLQMHHHQNCWILWRQQGWLHRIYPRVLFCDHWFHLHESDNYLCHLVFHAKTNNPSFYVLVFHNNHRWVCLLVLL